MLEETISVKALSAISQKLAYDEQETQLRADLTDACLTASAAWGARAGAVEAEQISPESVPLQTSAIWGVPASGNLKFD